MNKRIFYLVFILIGLLGEKAMAQDPPSSVSVERVAYCKKNLFCKIQYPHEYRFWKHNGVPKRMQKRTYMARYNEPARDNVRHLVFLSAGQRFNKEFRDQLVTGSTSLEKFHKKTRDRDMDVNPWSLPVQIFDQGIYSLEDTFVGLALDARFNWGFRPKNKRRIINAHYDWLRSKADMSQVETVYLAGHSRGGLLVLRLAQRFTQDYPHIRVIVHAFDPVPNVKQEEFGVTDSRIISPFSPPNLVQPRFARVALFESQLLNRDNLSIYNFLSGERFLSQPVDFFGDRVRSFGQVNSGVGSGDDIFTIGDWYAQQWFADTHNGIAGNFNGVIRIALEDLEDQLAAPAVIATDVIQDETPIIDPSVDGSHILDFMLSD